MANKIKFSISVLFLPLVCLQANGLWMTALPDREISITVGSVKITTFNPVTITGLEYSTNLYFTVKNTGLSSVTLNMISMQKIIDKLPNWIFHFFAFQAEAVHLCAGEEKTLEYLLTNEGQGSKTLPFTFQVEGSNQKKTIQIKLRSLGKPSLEDIPNIAEVNGTVTSLGGLPIAGAEVKLYIFRGDFAFTEWTDTQGRFQFRVPSVADIQQALGSRPLPYQSYNFFLGVEAEGYEFGYYDDIAPVQGDQVSCSMTLDTVEKPSYDMIGQLVTDGVHGYFWLLPDQRFDRLAAVQGRHPQALQKPGHLVMTDTLGNEQWRVVTGDECWGLDVVKNRIAAGCHDGSVYVTDLSGNVLLQFNCGGMNREVEIDPKAKYLFTGPYMGQDAALLRIADGKILWTYTDPRQWLRNSRFSRNGRRIVAGFSAGTLVMLTNNGKVLWKNYIGEFPLLLEIDKKNNVYAAGKNRELFSFDGKGNLRWRYRIPDHVVSAGSDNISRDGNLIVLGTVAGMLYAFDKSGKILWRRKMSNEAILQGHNALDITPDGRWILVGSAGDDRSVLLYDHKGTLIWNMKFFDRRDSREYDHNQTGPITVAISDDASLIAAGFGDSIIRIFQRK